MRASLIITMLLLFIYRSIMPSIAAESDGGRRLLLILHSYDTNYEWTVNEDRGIDRAFAETVGENSRWDVRRIYLSGKRYQEEPGKMQAILQHARQEIAGLKPDAAVIMDDLAFICFYKSLREMEIPISFGGINGYVEDYGYREGDLNVTGALEHKNYAAITRVIHAVKPTIEEVAFVGDLSRTTDGMIKSIKRGLKMGRYDNANFSKFSFLTTGSYSALKKYLLSVDPDNTAVVFISQYTLKDKSGNMVSREEVDRWIRLHTRLVDAGITSPEVNYRRLISWVSSAEDIGYYCTKQLLEAVIAGKELSSLPIRKFLPIRVVLNKARAEDLGIQFPYDLLAYVLNTSRFYEKRWANNDD